MPRKLGFSEAKQRAGRFCAFRERSPKEVEEKLRSWGLRPDETASLLKELLSEKFVDEQRFANAFCHDKFEFNSWGKLKIKAQIYNHALSPKVVEEALQRIDEEKYFDRLTELAKRKWALTKKGDLGSRKRKVFSFLASKGFESDLIWRAIELVMKE